MRTNLPGGTAWISLNGVRSASDTLQGIRRYTNWRAQSNPCDNSGARCVHHRTGTASDNKKGFGAHVVSRKEKRSLVRVPDAERPISQELGKALRFPRSNAAKQRLHQYIQRRAIPSCRISSSRLSISVQVRMHRLMKVRLISSEILS